MRIIKRQLSTAAPEARVRSPDLAVADRWPRHAGRAAGFSGEHRLPRDRGALWPADPDDPVDRDQLCADADQPDADVWPRRRHAGLPAVFLCGTGVSAIAFVACALAPTYPALLAARVAQGIGAGLILSCGPALATSLFPEAMRTQVLARYMMMFGIGSALGPSVFGLLVERFGWSAVFSFRAPIAAAAFLLAWTLPRPARGERETFDAAGGALLALALRFMLLALNRLRPPGSGNRRVRRAGGGRLCAVLPPGTPRAEADHRFPTTFTMLTSQ